MTSIRLGEELLTPSLAHHGVLVPHLGVSAAVQAVSGAIAGRRSGRPVFRGPEEITWDGSSLNPYNSKLPRVRNPLTEPEPINRQFLRHKLFFKIGDRITLFRPYYRAPEVRPFGCERDLGEVLLMIGLDPELSAINQAATNPIKKFTINDSARLMSPLRPRVRKVQVKTPHRISWQHVPYGVIDF